MSTKLVSIIIPTYNRAHLIGETLDSVIAQTYQHWECIVVDDGSNDQTLEIINRASMLDRRIKIVKRDKNYNSGGNGARNLGIQSSKAEWLIFLDSDDLLTRDCLKKRMKYLRKEPNSDMIVSHSGSFYDQMGDSQLIWNFFTKMSCVEAMKRFVEQDMPWHTNGVLWKRVFLIRIGSWNVKLKAWQDWEIHMRAMTFFPKILFTNEMPDNYYRLDVKNSISKKKNNVEYIKNISIAIKEIEPKINSLNDKELMERFKYLKVRMLISSPLKINNKMYPFHLRKNILEPGSFSVFDFLRYYFLELLFLNTFIKRLCFRIIKVPYLEKINAKTTHLRKDINFLKSLKNNIHE